MTKNHEADGLFDSPIVVHAIVDDGQSGSQRLGELIVLLCPFHDHLQGGRLETGI
jgi:hypothetical protein